MAQNRAYFRITRCCNSSETGLFTFDTNTPFALGPVPDSIVVVFNGTDDTVTGDGGGTISFINGDCYTIESTDLNNFVIPFDLVEADFAATLSGDCRDSVCNDCSTSPKKLVFTPCCEQYPTLEFQGTNYQDYLGVIIPVQTNKQPISGQFQLEGGGFNNPTYAQLEFGNCYEVTVVDITQAEFDSLDRLPPYVEGDNFQQIADETSGLDCTSTQVIEACPDCRQFCYTVYNCDGGFFDVLSDPDQYGVDDISNYVGQFVTLIDNDLGTPLAGTFFVTENPASCVNAVATISVDPVLPAECDCRCFEIVGNYSFLTYVDCDNNFIQVKLGPSKFCSKIYPVVNVLPETPTPQITEGSNCVDGECPIECFTLVNCETDEVLFTESELYSYFLSGQIVTLDGYEGCWTVLSGDCSCITFTIDAVQYEAKAASSYNGRLVYTLEYNLTPYFVWFDGASWIMSQSTGDLSTQIASAKSSLECPGDVGFPWLPTGGSPITTITSELCTIQCDDCLTNVTVLTTFDDCETCIGPIAYKLTGCDNAADVIYTTDDLSAYVGKTVELQDCGCYTVELINFVPPTDTTVTVLYSFDNCVDCKSIFYVLTDCADPTKVIYTTVDLSAYEGQVIKIQNCENCWTVSTTREPGTVETVVFTESFDTCLECGYDVPCVCSKITNVSDSQQSITYVNCDNATVFLLLEAGETSEKVCLKYWNIPEVAEDDPPIWYPEYFGNCQEGVCPPVEYKNNRKVKPGYNTPICSAEKYDRITCEFADMYYKKALQDRYGISNCCPEELQNWKLKKRLIDVQALKDPDFNCSAQSKCSCGNTSTCTSCNCKN